MRKLLISIFLVSILMGAALPAMANPQTNNADIHQNQVAVPVAIGDAAAGGGILSPANAGNQLTQIQIANQCQVNQKLASDNGIYALSPFAATNRNCSPGP